MATTKWWNQNLASKSPEFDYAILNLKEMTRFEISDRENSWHPILVEGDEKFQLEVGHFDSAILNFRSPITSDSKPVT